MIDVVRREIGKVLGGIRLAFRAVLTRLTTAGPVALVQADALVGERLQDNELMQHYGLTSAPPPGTMAIVLPIGGRTAHGVVIATEHGAFRFKGLLPGEVALYTDEGDRIGLRRGRLVEIVTQTLRIEAGVKVEIVSPLVTTSGEVQVAEDLWDRKAHPDASTMRGMRDVYDTHTHGENDVHGETDPPTQGM